MTEGATFPLLIRFASSLMLGSIFQHLYNLADMSIAGYTLGDHALAAISASSALITLINATAMGFNSGNSILVSQNFGAGNWEGARKAFAGVLKLCIGLIIIFTAVLYLTIGPLLKLVQTPEEIFTDAKAYIMTLILGLFCTMMYNMYAGVYRALGNSVVPLVFLIICACLNIGLDILFIVPLRMGVVGAGLATVVSQGLSVLMSAIHFHKNYPEMRLKKEDLRANPAMMRKMLPMGISVAFSNSLFAIGDIAIQGAVNSLGQEAIIAKAASQKIRSFAIVPSINMAHASATFTAQNYGAKKYERIPKGVYLSVLFNIAVNMITTAIAFAFGGSLIRLVTNTDSALVIANGQLMLRVVVPFIFTQTIVTAYRMALQSMEHKLAPIIGTGIELCTRFFCAFVLAPIWGFAGICWAEPLSWVVSGAVMFIWFNIAIKKLLKYNTNTTC
jgi:putative MATE family efflux protein